MADLSNLLGDVYGDPAPEPAPAPEPPAWADDSRLDEAFADWTPEPLEAVVAKAPSSPSAQPPSASAPLDDDLAAALSAALADAPRAPAAAPVEQFSHVDADAATLPPVVDGATLERVPGADSIADALDAIVVAPPTPVTDTPKKRGLSLSLSLTRSRKTAPDPVAAVPAEPVPAVAVEPHAEPPAVVGAGRPWQPSDDDILPARTGGGRKSVSFRLR
jgi:hypothetical protein